MSSSILHRKIVLAVISFLPDVLHHKYHLFHSVFLYNHSPFPLLIISALLLICHL